MNANKWLIRAFIYISLTNYAIADSLVLLPLRFNADISSEDIANADSSTLSLESITVAETIHGPDGTPWIIEGEPVATEILRIPRKNMARKGVLNIHLNSVQNAAGKTILINKNIAIKGKTISGYQDTSYSEQTKRKFPHIGVAGLSATIAGGVATTAALPLAGIGSALILQQLKNSYGPTNPNPVSFADLRNQAALVQILKDSLTKKSVDSAYEIAAASLSVDEIRQNISIGVENPLNGIEVAHLDMLSTHGFLENQPIMVTSHLEPKTSFKTRIVFATSDFTPEYSREDFDFTKRFTASFLKNPKFYIGASVIIGAAALATAATTSLVVLAAKKGRRAVIKKDAIFGVLTAYDSL